MYAVARVSATIAAVSRAPAVRLRRNWDMLGNLRVQCSTPIAASVVMTSLCVGAERLESATRASRRRDIRSIAHWAE